MDIQVIEYVSTKLFNGNPISDAFWLIDNRKAAVVIFFIGLFATFYRSYLEKCNPASTTLSNPLIQIRIWDWIGCVMMALGAFSYCYGLTDEVFINLVHPLNLIEHGIFSFDPQKKIDGTVENLFYFFHVLGGSPQGIIRFNFLFSFFLHLFSAIIVGSLFYPSSQWKLVRNLYVLFPPLVFAVSGGFGAVFLNFLFILAVFAITKYKKKLFYFAVSIIALSRPEGIAFSAVLVATWFIYYRQITIPLLMTLLGSFGFFCFNYFYYGHWIPTPLYFKAVPSGCVMHPLDLFIRGFSIFSYSSYDSSIFINSFFSHAKSSFLYTLYETIWKIFIYLALIIALIESLYALIQYFYSDKKPEIRSICGILLIGLMPIFIIYTDPPGSLGGQLRYFIVNISLVFLVLANLLNLKSNLSARWICQNAAKILLILFYIYTSYLYFGAKIQLIYNRNFDANVGLLFKNLPTHLTFSSSEMDTLGFFSGRSMIDLWGYTNKAISQSGLYTPHFGKRVNPDYFLKILPVIEYNTSCTSKIDWSKDRLINKQLGDETDYDYSFSGILRYPPKQRRDEHRHFLFPSEPGWLVDNLAMPTYHGDPVKVFALYNILFIHDDNRMFAFLLRKDSSQEFDTWAAKQGLKKVITRITNHLPQYNAQDYITTELPCKFFCKKP